MQAYKTRLLRSLLDPGWKRALEGEFAKPYFNEICASLSQMREAEVFPPIEHIFEAFNFCPLQNTKVVIVGQDPYHDDNQAHGLCFSVQPGIKVPPSLRNMYTELEQDIKGFKRPDHGYLLSWAKQGILLLNATLTVTPHKANSHKNIGWQTFTDAVLQVVNEGNTRVVFALWGGFAKKKGRKIDRQRHAIIECAHPSPLSVTKWRGCRTFSLINEALEASGNSPIDWTLPRTVTLEKPVAGVQLAASSAPAASESAAAEVPAAAPAAASTMVYAKKASAQSEMLDDADLHASTVTRLKQMLRTRGLVVSGRKADLIERLMKSDVSLKRRRGGDDRGSGPAKRHCSSPAEVVATPPREQAAAAPVAVAAAAAPVAVAAAAAPAVTAPAAAAVTPVAAGSVQPVVDAAGETDFSQPKVAPGVLKIVTWNVASWKAVQGKGFFEYVAAEDPDILCLNETKIASDRAAPNALPGYHQTFLGNKASPGYAGVAIFSKQEPLSVTRGLGVAGFDDEQRALTVEFDNMFVVATYVPNAGMKLKRLDYRLEWDQHMSAFLLELEKRKPVVWCGDLNVARLAIDLANPKQNKRTAGFSPEERASFEKHFVDKGLVDAFRMLYPEQEKAYTFWPYRLNCRAKGLGWRLDYFMLSRSLTDKVRQCWIRKNVMGSDHCPHGLLLAE